MDFQETIRYSMNQTKDVQKMADTLMKWCKELMEYVTILEEKNKRLERELDGVKN